MAVLSGGKVTYPHHKIVYNDEGGYGIQVIKNAPNLWTGSYGGPSSSRPSQVSAEDAASPLGNPIPKLVGAASFVGQLIIDADHFGGVRLK
ncbi:hypothetical protein [Aminobacter aminovorans]|uniref:Uncharacterized protein n=1 Tax=Aminobacter aminovorans TaxID=83263 RepID=A0AAC8YMN7_AMIAI|nr:hypothetical protein [Aminobacter aminovorans]AMS41152.1 hypothetical protein AA2016_2223 [Aminobacter aminovorans]MBB3705867.1 hypothetical protein [Aminobacter aminovorans]